MERLTLEERLERTYDELREGLAVEILDMVENSSPEFFERLVVDLIVRMGYGGPWRMQEVPLAGRGMLESMG